MQGGDGGWGERSKSGSGEVRCIVQHRAVRPVSAHLEVGRVFVLLVDGFGHLRLQSPDQHLGGRRGRWGQWGWWDGQWQHPSARTSMCCACRQSDALPQASS